VTCGNLMYNLDQQHDLQNKHKTRHIIYVKP